MDDGDGNSQTHNKSDLAICTYSDVIPGVPGSNSVDSAVKKADFKRINKPCGDNGSLVLSGVSGGNEPRAAPYDN
jgi:hypothetical protein